MNDQHYLGIEGELVKKADGYPVKIGFVGCGSHSFRNIFSALRYLPIDLVGVVDFNKEKAELYRRQFGARNSYTNYKEMIEKEELDGVIVVVGYAEDGSPQYFPIVKDLLEHNIPVWFEKPPTRNAEEVKSLIKIEEKSKAFAQVGFKKMFMPSIRKINEIINSKEFGKITSYTLRYPVDLPKDIRDIKSADARRFIDDFVHVASTIVATVGRPDQLSYYRTSSGSAIATFIHKEKDFVGSLHLCPGSSEMCPLEQLEIIGQNANVTLDNIINIKYYPPTKRLPYGTTPEFLPTNSNGASSFTPEFSLGQIYNKAEFLVGYYHELQYFIENVRTHKKSKTAGLKDALSVMQLYDGFAGEEGTLINLEETQRLDKKDQTDSKSENPTCPNCQGEMYLKDGWNYTCKVCGKMVAASELSL